MKKNSLSRLPSPPILVIVALLGFALSLGGVLAGLYPYYDVPKKESLVSVTGKFDGLKDRRVTRYGSNLIITLENDATEYIYSSKATRFGTVKKALTRKGISVELLCEPSIRLQTCTVFSLIVDGQTIRSYDEIRSEYASDNRIGFWLAGFFIPSSIFLLFMAYLTGKQADHR